MHRLEPERRPGHGIRRWRCFLFTKEPCLPMIQPQIIKKPWKELVSFSLESTSVQATKDSRLQSQVNHSFDGQSEGSGAFVSRRQKSQKRYNRFSSSWKQNEPQKTPSMVFEFRSFLPCHTGSSNTEQKPPAKRSPQQQWRSNSRRALLR